MHQDTKHFSVVDKWFYDYSQTILTFTYQYNTLVIDDILESQKYVEEPDRFYYTIVHKVNATLEGCVLFIANFNRKYSYRIGLYVLLRSMIADLITAEFIKRTPQSKEEREGLIQQINADHFYHTYKQIDREYAQLNRATHEEIHETKQQLRDRYPHYFAEDGELKPKKNLSFKLMINKLQSVALSETDRRTIKRLYSYYDHYSKFEHLGDLSFFLTHEIYNPKSLQQEYEKVSECIWLITYEIAVMSDHWPALKNEPIGDLLPKILDFHPKKFAELLK